MTTQAQPIERTKNPKVVGSNPTPACKQSKGRAVMFCFLIEPEDSDYSPQFVGDELKLPPSIC